jgi:hypothetical protein
MVLSLAYYRYGRWRQARMMAAPEGGVDAVAMPAEVPANATAPVADLGARTSDD